MELVAGEDLPGRLVRRATPGENRHGIACGDGRQAQTDGHPGESKELMRTLVSIETVAAVRSIPDADAIEAITIRGWTVVAKKGEFAAGDPCVYIEIDAALPLDDPRFAFLAPRGTKTTVEGRLVHVLKTARLRGVFSQGLALPLRAFPDVSGAPPDADLAALLTIEKWEPPVHASLGGDIVGAFPTSLARKTDAERVQNLVDVYPALRERTWVATEKSTGRQSPTSITEAASACVAATGSSPKAPTCIG